MDHDIIIPGCSFVIHPRGIKYRQKGFKIRATVTSIYPASTEKHAVYFDLNKTLVSTTEVVPIQNAEQPSKVVLQMNGDGVGGLSTQITTINKRLSFGTQVVPKMNNVLGNTSFLLHGPEGTGKSFLLDRLASCPWEAVYRVNPETHPKIQPKAISDVFEAALENQPSLILMDDLDKFLEKAQSLVSRLQIELARVKGSQVVVAAAARSVYDVNVSLRTSLTLKFEIELLPPNAKQREEILRQIFDHAGIPAAVDFVALAERTHGFLYRDIYTLCDIARERHIEQVYSTLSDDQKVAFGDTQEQWDSVAQEDFDAVIDQVQPSVLKDSVLEVPKVLWSDIAGLDHVRAQLEMIIIRPVKVCKFRLLSNELRLIITATRTLRAV